MPKHNAAALLAWFGSNGREFPWRSRFPRDPYQVLVSEVMAQQTQVERVVPAFVAFLVSFPTVEMLAAAALDDVLAAFSGLGYYRRARLLHRAAQEIVLADQWPITARELARLPAVGTYTAAAIAAFAFAGEEPPVDGNVARVAARLENIALPMGSQRLLARARVVARSLFEQTRTPAIWEALMELGALCCTPTSPRCDSCPIFPSCCGARSGSPCRFPFPRPRRPVELQHWVALWVLRDDGQVLLRRIPDSELLGGLWLPPLARVPVDDEAAHAARELAFALGLSSELIAGPAVKHSITHHAITVLPFTIHAGLQVREPRSELRWAAPAEPGLPTSSLLIKVARACQPMDPVNNWPVT